MFAPEVPAHIHQFDCIEGASSTPWRAGRVGAFAREVVFDGNESVVRGGSNGHSKVVTHVSEEYDIDIFEDAGADVVRLCSQEFFRHAWPELDGSGKMLPFHDSLHLQRGEDIERHSGIVAFSMSRRARDDRFVIRNARFL